MPALKSIASLDSVSLATSILLLGCVSSPCIAETTARTGDEIVAAGQSIHAHMPVVLWADPGAYDAYRVESPFAVLVKSDWQNTQEKVKACEIPCRVEVASVIDWFLDHVVGRGGKPLLGEASPGQRVTRPGGATGAFFLRRAARGLTG